MEFTEVQIKFVGNFKVGDNIEYNADVLYELVKNNKEGIFNKMILIQAASITEICIIEIIYRANHFTNERVPNIKIEYIEKRKDTSVEKFNNAMCISKKYNL